VNQGIRRGRMVGREPSYQVKIGNEKGSDTASKKRFEVNHHGRLRTGVGGVKEKDVCKFRLIGMEKETMTYGGNEKAMDQ